MSIATDHLVFGFGFGPHAMLSIQSRQRMKVRAIIRRNRCQAVVDRHKNSSTCFYEGVNVCFDFFNMSPESNGVIFSVHRECFRLLASASSRATVDARGITAISRTSQRTVQSLCTHKNPRAISDLRFAQAEEEGRRRGVS